MRDTFIDIMRRAEEIPADAVLDWERNIYLTEGGDGSAYWIGRCKISPADNGNEENGWVIVDLEKGTSVATEQEWGVNCLLAKLFEDGHRIYELQRLPE